jgi:hypothetical protein
MATTTNYGWTTPDDTALVKDGAAAIRTLGSSVDTTTKALNPSTTLGDIEYRSSTANTNTRLGIGSTGNVLTVTGGVPTWAAPAAGGGLTLLSTTTLSGASTLISSISGSYKQLFIHFYDVYTAAGDTFYLRLNDDSTSKHDYAVLLGSATYYSVLDDQVDTIILSDTTNQTDAWSMGHGVIEIANYTDTTVAKTVTFQTRNKLGTAAGNRRFTEGIGNYRGTSAISSMRFLTGSTFSGGTVKIWGVN